MDQTKKLAMLIKQAVDSKKAKPKKAAPKQTKQAEVVQVLLALGLQKAAEEGAKLEKQAAISDILGSTAGRVGTGAGAGAGLGALVAALSPKEKRTVGRYLTSILGGGAIGGGAGYGADVLLNRRADKAEQKRVSDLQADYQGQADEYSQSTGIEPGGELISSWLKDLLKNTTQRPEELNLLDQAREYGQSVGMEPSLELIPRWAKDALPGR